MKLETATSGNEGIMEFWNAYCKVCQTKVDGIMQKCRDRLLEHPKTENLMKNWDILGVSYEVSGIVECVMPDGIKHKVIYKGLNARNYLAKEYEQVPNFHKKKEVVLQKDMSLDIEKQIILRQLLHLKIGGKITISSIKYFGGLKDTSLQVKFLMSWFLFQR